MDLSRLPNFPLNYVEDLNEYLNKEIQVQVFDVEEEDNRLILSARELLREKAEEERRAKVSMWK